MRVYGLALSLVVLSWFQPSLAFQTIADGGSPASGSGSVDVLKWSVTQGGVTVVALVLVYLLWKQLQTTKEDKERLLTAYEKNAAAFTSFTESNNRLARVLESRGVV